MVKSIGLLPATLCLEKVYGMRRGVTTMSPMYDINEVLNAYVMSVGVLDGA